MVQEQRNRSLPFTVKKNSLFVKYINLLLKIMSSALVSPQSIVFIYDSEKVIRFSIRVYLLTKFKQILIFKELNKASIFFFCKKAKFLNPPNNVIKCNFWNVKVLKGVM